MGEKRRKTPIGGGTIPRPAKRNVSLATRLTVRLSHTEQLLLTKYLSVLLKSGLAIDDALDILLEQSEGPLKKVLATLRESVRTGHTMADGLEAYPHIFSSVYVNLIRAGEASGTLQGNFEQLAEQMQKEHELRQKIQGALMYPSIVLLSAIVISGFIVVFILPNITALFDSLDVPLPLTTKILLWISETLQAHGVLIGFGALGAVALFMFLRTLPFIQPITGAIFLRTPVVGKIARNTNLARVTRLLGTLLKTGMPISDALDVTISVLRNVHYRRLFAHAKESVGQGNMFASALGVKKRLVPPIALRLIRVGEETGTLGDMLVYLAGFYEQEVDDATKNATTLMEPLLIVMIGVMVGVLAFSIITPIYKVVGAI